MQNNASASTDYTQADENVLPQPQPTFVTSSTSASAAAAVSSCSSSSSSGHETSSSAVRAFQQSSDSSRSAVPCKVKSQCNQIQVVEEDEDEVEDEPIETETAIAVLSDTDNDDIESMSAIESYLRSIWEQLDVGKNGFLNVTDLKLVCNNIGMSEMTDEVINQLFTSLDTDQDGMVSFDELLQGMFKQQQQVRDVSFAFEDDDEIQVEVHEDNDNYPLITHSFDQNTSG